MHRIPFATMEPNSAKQVVNTQQQSRCIPHCLNHSLGGNELTGQGAQVPESGARMGAFTYYK